MITNQFRRWWWARCLSSRHDRTSWHGSAIELDPVLVAHLKNNLCIEVHEGDLRSLTPKTVGSFDLITFNKVLEHIIDPVELLHCSLSFFEKERRCLF